MTSRESVLVGLDNYLRSALLLTHSIDVHVKLNGFKDSDIRQKGKKVKYNS